MLLGIDPGTRKCGIAVIERLGTSPVALAIVPLAGFTERLRAIVAAHPIDVIAVGRGTNAETIAEAVRTTGIPFAFVDEYATTLRARARYFRDHPPRGWKRLIPLGMQLPDRPIDDYAALLIAERYLETTT